MTSSLRLVMSAAAVLATALLVAGCTTSPGSSTPSTSSAPTPDGSGSSTVPVAEDDFEAAWLDDGRLFAIVTWGSSMCVPVVDEVTASGQTVTVALVDAPSADGAETACTDDLVPRASIGGVPEGVDPKQDVEFIVTAGDVTDDIDLDGNAALAGTPGEPSDFLPSAGWFDDEGVVLLTWGSSTCPPVVENLEEQPGGATVTFKPHDGICTMDMAPRATMLGFSDDSDDSEENDFILTLVGDNLDGTVTVIGS
ncbi:hypothetical protein ACW5CM_06255 [Microbacterium sp. A588]